MKGAVGDAFYALDWITARHVHEYFDVGGRPLGEGRAAAFDKIQTELHPSISRNSIFWTGTR